MNYLCGKQCWGFFCLGRAGSEKGNVSSELYKSEKKRLVGFGLPSFNTVWVHQGLMKLILWVNRYLYLIKYRKMLISIIIMNKHVFGFDANEIEGVEFD